MKEITFLLFGLVILSCSQKEVRPKKANLSCNDFFVQGQFKNSAYTFCAIIPQEVEYLYKSGKWKYWNLKGQLVAEGIYKLEKITIEGRGGCPYEIIKGKIDKEKWQFWDKNSNQIKPNSELIKRIESCIVYE